MQIALPLNTPFLVGLLIHFCLLASRKKAISAFRHGVMFYVRNLGINSPRDETNWHMDRRILDQEITPATVPQEATLNFTVILILLVLSRHRCGIRQFRHVHIPAHLQKECGSHWFRSDPLGYGWQETMPVYRRGLACLYPSYRTSLPTER